MKSLLDKFRPLVDELESKHGTFVVFALFLRVLPFEQWDVVVSATWLNEGDMRCYDLVAPEIPKILKGPDFLQISRVVIVPTEDPATAYLQETFALTDDQPMAVGSEPLSSRFGFDIKYGYFLRCQKRETESDQIAL